MPPAFHFGVNFEFTSHCTGPSIDPIFEAQPASYWVSSSNAGDPCHGSQFVVSFGSGAVNLVGAPDARAYLRAVREPR